MRSDPQSSPSPPKAESSGNPGTPTQGANFGQGGGNSWKNNFSNPWNKGGKGSQKGWQNNPWRGRTTWKGEPDFGKGGKGQKGKGKGDFAGKGKGRGKGEMSG